MESTAISPRPFPLWVTFVLLLAAPVLVFWRPGQPFFYILDDWRILQQVVELPFWQYLTVPNTEHWYPLTNLICYGLFKLFGDHYSLLVLVNCLLTGVNAFLLYLFYRFHLSPSLALALSLFYAIAGVHPAAVWNSSYICFILALGLFMGALLLMQLYLQTPSSSRLFGVGLCGLLAVLSNNFVIVALAALPFYPLFLGEREAKRRFWALALVVVLCYLAFIIGYSRFAGVRSATTLNYNLFSLPGPAYLLHLAYGAVLSPFFYLFWGYYHFPVWAYVAAVATLALSVALVWWGGAARERRLALWILFLSVLPMLLVSLIRYQKAPEQAFVPRYASYTLIGALLFVGIAWNILSRWLPARPWARILLPLGFLAILVYGQLGSLHSWREKYLEYSRNARDFYQEAGTGKAGTLFPPGDKRRDFLPWDCRNLTRAQALDIRRFLQGDLKRMRGAVLPPETGGR